MNFNFKNLRLFLLCVIFTNSLVAQNVPPLFVNELVSNGWNQLVGFTFDGNNRMYVWEKDGRVWTVSPSGVKSSIALLDISQEVGGWRDHGLNGFALDPAFMTNGYIYLMYTVDRHHLLYFGTPQYNATTNEYFNATIIRITRYQVDVANGNYNSVVPGSRLVLVGSNKKNGIPLLHESHSGGQIVFGDDGTLLVSTGDGASYNLVDVGSSSDTYWAQGLADSIIRPKENVGAMRSQLVDCLAGKVLRIDPTNGNGLPTNPFYDPANPKAAKSLVWSLGLRNPFRMTMRKGTGSSDPTAGDPGSFYIGDVGWYSYEDLHVATRPGLNFGWPIFEGLTYFSGYASALTQNLDAPNPLFGIGGCTKQYFDFQELIRQATLAPVDSFVNPCNALSFIPTSIPQFYHERPSVDWLHGNQSRTGIFNGVNAAEIDLDNPASPVPGPRFGGNASCGGVWYTGTKLPFQYQNSYFHADFGAGWIKKFKFDANDKVESATNFADNLGPVVFLAMNPVDQSLMYVKYPAEIRRIRYTGVINNPPIAVLSKSSYFGSSPLSVNFNSSFSSDPELRPMTYAWDFGDGATSTNPNPTHQFFALSTAPQNFLVKLTVTDDIGQTSTDSTLIFVNNTPPVVTITSFNNGDLYPTSAPFYLPLFANVSDIQSPEPSLKYSWQTILHHNFHEHPEGFDTNRISQTYITPESCNEVFYYEIKLTVTDPQGLSTTVLSSIYPSCNRPVAAFTSNYTKVCRSKSIQFTDNSQNATSWQWTFTGGTPSTSNLKNPIVTYNTSGNFTVKLVALNNIGKDSVTLTNYINVYTTPTATVNPTTRVFYCNGGAPNILTAVTNVQNPAYQWQFNSTNILGATNSTYGATTQANYRVLLTDPFGCTRTSNTTVLSLTPINKVTAGGPTTFCVGGSVVLSATTSTRYAYQWTLNNVNIPGANSVSYIANQAGQYRVIVTDLPLGCSRVSSPVTVRINCKLDQPIAGNFDLQLAPNPANDLSTIQFNLIKTDNIVIDLFDAAGRRIENIYDGLATEGINNLDFSVSNLADGIYFIKIISNEQQQVARLVVSPN